MLEECAFGVEVPFPFEACALHHALGRSEKCLKYALLTSDVIGEAEVNETWFPSTNLSEFLSAA